mmetsp:Transcript_102124/g.319189  ORF Transcript_102124/g.319189 Transcript_102124/m.319189 type:complete len:292 (-) Transcript_102124:1-876(-)
MLAVTPVLVVAMAGVCLWLLIRRGELTLLRFFGDVLFFLMATLAAGGSGVVVLACRWLAPKTLAKVYLAVDAVVCARKRDASSNFETVCDVAFGLALAYEVPQTRQQFCKLPWIAAGALLALELLVSICSGRVLAFVAVFLLCAGQALLTGLAAIALAPRGPSLDCPTGAAVPERAVACMGRSPVFAAAVAALVTGLVPTVEARLGLDSLNDWAHERLQSLRVVIQELHLMRRSLIKAARTALALARGNWSIQETVGGLTAGVTNGVSMGVESMSSGVSSIAKGASSLLFG